MLGISHLKLALESKKLTENEHQLMTAIRTALKDVVNTIGICLQQCRSELNYAWLPSHKTLENLVRRHFRA